jgi:hypothetical protein
MKEKAILHQGARKWKTKQEMTKNGIQRMNFPWIPSFYPLFLTKGSSFVTKKVTKSLAHTRLAVTSQLMASTPTAISSGCFTIPPRNLLQESEARFARVTITDHLDSCGAFDLVQRQYLHDIKPAAQYGMHPIRMFCLGSTTDWYRDVGKDYVKDADDNVNVRLAYAYDTPLSVWEREIIYPSSLQ